MTVLYVTLGWPNEGVRKKMRDKAAFMRQQGLHVRLLAISGDKHDGADDAEVLPVSLRLARALSSLPLLWRLSVYAEQWILYKAFAEYLRLGTDADVILLRYPVADYFLDRFMNRLARRYRVVFEHNTLEHEELILRAASSHWFRYFLNGENRFGQSARLKAAGMVAVSHEIARRQLQLVREKVPVVTVSNGIDVARVRQRSSSRAYRGDVLNLLFLAGSDSPWHGVDILINSLKAYNGSEQLHCYIAGFVHASIAEQAHNLECVTLLPHQSAEQLDTLVDKCHIGIGSLALFRNNMKEACTLKVREYWARGLPFVLGYDDTDLVNNTDMADFYLKVEINDQLQEPQMAMSEIVAFANRVYKIENLHTSIREQAMRYIGYPSKAAAYRNFFENL